MKKKMIALVVLVFAVAITSYSVSGTYAKYTTTGQITNKASVAKWGIKVGESIKEDLNLFKPAYGDAASYEVQSANKTDRVIAPGSKGSAKFGLTLNGSPEVAFEIVSIVKVTDETNQLKFALVDSKNNKAGTEEAFTDSKENYTLTAKTLEEALAKALSGSDSSSKFTHTDEGDTKFDEGQTSTKNFAPNAKDLDKIFGEYTIYWMWDFDDNTGADPKVETTDTGLANKDVAPKATVDIKITANQLKESSESTAE